MKFAVRDLGFEAASPPPPQMAGAALNFANPQRGGQMPVYAVLAVGTMLAFLFLLQRLYTSLITRKRLGLEDCELHVTRRKGISGSECVLMGLLTLSWSRLDGSCLREYPRLSTRRHICVHSCRLTRSDDVWTETVALLLHSCHICKLSHVLLVHCLIQCCLQSVILSFPPGLA